MTPTWETELAALWSQLDSLSAADFVSRMDRVAAGIPDPALALFERAGARDSVGQEAEAVTLYRAALAAGLSGVRRRRAVIQLASSLRNVGQVAEGLRLLQEEKERAESEPSGELQDELAAFLALMLVDSGREREAVAALLTALAPHLQLYQRSVRNYARLLLE